MRSELSADEFKTVVLGLAYAFNATAPLIIVAARMADPAATDLLSDSPQFLSTRGVRFVADWQRRQEWQVKTPAAERAAEDVGPKEDSVEYQGINIKQIGRNLDDIFQKMREYAVLTPRESKKLVKAKTVLEVDVRVRELYKVISGRVPMELKERLVEEISKLFRSGVFTEDSSHAGSKKMFEYVRKHRPDFYTEVDLFLIFEVAVIEAYKRNEGDPRFYWTPHTYWTYRGLIEF